MRLHQPKTMLGGCFAGEGVPLDYHKVITDCRTCVRLHQPRLFTGSAFQTACRGGLYGEDETAGRSKKATQREDDNTPRKQFSQAPAPRKQFSQTLSNPSKQQLQQQQQQQQEQQQQQHQHFEQQPARQIPVPSLNVVL